MIALSALELLSHVNNILALSAEIVELGDAALRDH